MASVNEISELFEKTSSKRTELARYRSLLDVVEECTCANNFDPNLKAKINNIIYSKEVTPSLRINEHSEENLLGISLKQTALTNEDQQKLSRLVNLKLSSNRYNPTLTINHNTNFNFSILNRADTDLLELKTKLSKVQHQYFDNLLNYQRILENLLRIRLDVSKDLIDKKIVASRLTTNSLQLKNDILHWKRALSVFNEIPIAQQAYLMVLDDISKQQNLYRQQIEDLKAMKGGYKLVACKQYDEILNSYLSYKKIIEKKREILEKIK